MSIIASLLLMAAAPTAPVAATQARSAAPSDQPVPAGKLSSANLRGIAAALQEQGYRAQVKIEDGKAHVESAAEGATFWIYALNCEENGSGCKDLLFRSAYENNAEKPITNDAINAFNRRVRWVRGYLDDENDPVLEMDVLFSDLVIDRKMFLEALEVWSDSMAEFHKDIDF